MDFDQDEKYAGGNPVKEKRVPSWKRQHEEAKARQRIREALILATSTENKTGPGELEDDQGGNYPDSQIAYPAAIPLSTNCAGDNANICEDTGIHDNANMREVVDSCDQADIHKNAAILEDPNIREDADICDDADNIGDNTAFEDDVMETVATDESRPEVGNEYNKEATEEQVVKVECDPRNDSESLQSVESDHDNDVACKRDMSIICTEECIAHNVQDEVFTTVMKEPSSEPLVAVAVCDDSMEVETSQCDVAVVGMTEENISVAKTTETLMDEQECILATTDIKDESEATEEYNRAATKKSREVDEEGRTDMKESRTVDQEDRTDAKESREMDQEDRTDAKESRTVDQEDRTDAKESREMDEEDRTDTKESRKVDEEVRTDTKESRRVDEEDRTDTKESRKVDEEVRTDTKEIRRVDEEDRTDTKESRKVDEEDRTDNKESREVDQDGRTDTTESRKVDKDDKTDTKESINAEEKAKTSAAEQSLVVDREKEMLQPPENLTSNEIVALAAKEEEIATGNKLREDKEMLMAYIAEIETKYKERAVSRKKNAALDKIRPEESFFTGLDSSLKKNTAFVRKVKSFTANQMSQILSDLRQLNLTKYTSEVAAAIVEAKLKMTDVDTAVQLCVLFHQTYADFSGFLLENWQKVLAIRKDDKNINASKLRVDLRFYAECINYGVFTNREGLPILGNVLTVLINMDKEEHNNVNIILNFCRHCGDDFAGLVPTKLRKLSEQFNLPIPRSELLPKEKQKNVRTLLKDYFVSLSKHYVKTHRDLEAFLRQNRRILQTKGELSADRKAKQEKLETTYKRLKTAVESFAEQLDETVPDLPEDESLKLDEDASAALLVGQSGGEEGFSSAALWEDEEMRRFYEQLPDMREYVPALAHRGVVLPPAEPPGGLISEEILDAEIAGEEEGDLAAKEELPAMFDDIDEPESTCNASNKIVLDAYLNMLQNCVNREMIDTASVDFVMKLNTKFNRKKLTKLLFNVPRIRLDLLPFYSRLVANLYPVVPEIANDLALLLKHDFKYHIRKKDQINIESKVKNVRFIGELVKFRMYTKIEALYCVKVLLHDFTHHHIEMCCNLLETCGRFLFRHPETHQRTKVYLEQMMRKKCVMALDARYVTMIENVFYYVNPPEGNTAAKKVRPPLHVFMRRLLYQDLVKSNTDKILRLMRKFDWDQPDLAAYAVKCLTYAFNVKYYNIPCLANLLAGLVIKEDFVGTHVVDAVLEDIRMGLEVNLPKYNQRRVAMIKYLGELYNYRMVESGDIFKVLYLMITFGVTMDYNYPSLLDPPDNLIRIRLVCVLLDTCGQYFTNGTTKKKLDYFFTFFQHYFLFKRSDPYWTPEGEKFPFGIETIFRETLTSLRPHIHFFADVEECKQAITDLHTQLASDQPEFYKFEQLQPEHLLDESPTEDYGKNTMDTIVEGDDENSHNTAEDSSKYCEARDIDGQSSGDEETDHRDDLDDDEGDARLEAGTAHSDNEAEEEFLLSEAEGAEYHPRGVIHIECPEDDDFMSNFDRMVSDNIHDRMRETVKPQQVDISVPLHVKSHSKKSYDQLCDTKQEDETTTNFILMLRKGNKPQYKTLSVPVDSELALNLKDQEEAEKIEKERVKRLTLNINERLEEEDYQEMMTQSPKPMIMNLNRERRPKYQHPRGAPDADLIFGSKRISKSSLQPM